MGFLDDLGKVMDAVEAATPVDLVNGVRSAWTDVPNFAKDVLHGDVHAALNDGRSVVGDADDVVQGLSSLGVSMGPLPGAFSDSKVVKLAESKVLSAAQLAIAGLKKTTGSGEPCTGDEFRDSGEHLKKVVVTLNEAEPRSDRWDGTASQVYNATNASHRRLTSDVAAADLAIADAIDTEAGQVARTRTALDDASQHLTDYDLATCWMNATPPTRVIKFTLDCAAAAAALTEVTATMAILVNNSRENALAVYKHLDTYKTAAKDTSGNPIGGCDVFSPPEEPLPRGDEKATPMPHPEDGTVPPSRSQPTTPYTEPEPEKPPVFGPPSTPYGSVSAPAAP